MKNPFHIHLTANQISSNSQQAITLQKSKKLGEIKNKKIIYSPYEALYLIENKKAEILKNNKPLSEQEIIKAFAKKHKDFYIKYLAFKYLRKKGYTVKTALKFGGEFRVYEKNKSHAKYICTPLIQSTKINWEEFIAKNRVAHQSAKKLLIAIVDSEESITFYETNWVKP